MKEGLNLLPSVAKFQAAKIRLKKRINLAMIVFLGGWEMSNVPQSFGKRCVDHGGMGRSHFPASYGQKGLKCSHSFVAGLLP